MRHQFGLRLVHGLHWGTGQFKLTAGLKRNGSATDHIIEADDIAPLHDRLPAEQKPHAFQKRADSPCAFVGYRLMAR